MKRMFTHGLLASIVSLACSSGVALAQTRPESPLADTIDTALPPASATNLPEDTVVAYLRSVDPNFKTLPGQTANTYTVRFRHEKWNYTLRIEIHGNCFWLNCDLSKPFAKTQKLTTDVLVRMGEMNYKVGPTFFAFSRSGSTLQLCLCRCLGRNITMAQFRSCIDLFLADIRTTQPVWSDALALLEPAPVAGGNVKK